MRTNTFVSILGAATLAMVAGCTVKDVDQPPLAGPSTLALSITTLMAARGTFPCAPTSPSMAWCRTMDGSAPSSRSPMARR